MVKIKQKVVNVIKYRDLEDHINKLEGIYDYSVISELQCGNDCIIQVRVDTEDMYEDTLEYYMSKVGIPDGDYQIEVSW
jgi:hypothetical protein